MTLAVKRQDGGRLEFVLPADALGALTATFAPMEFRRCACNCIFCFVDQNPPGLRSGIYVKDEDYRFSFLYGNYITLTSLGKHGLERIIEQRLSPLFVSVHCTDPRLRGRMLGLPESADIRTPLRGLAERGIELHTQVVLCPGWNDGPVLERTFRDLFCLRRQDHSPGGVASLVVVPVGLTAHREGLAQLEPVTPAIAADVIGQVAPWQAEATAVWGGAFLHLSDEFYLLAGQPIPPSDQYGDFPQEDNGAGQTRRLQEIWHEDLGRIRPHDRASLRPLTILTSTLAAVAFGRVLLPPPVGGRAVPLEVTAVRNEFYGASVTVAGLLSGADIRRELLSLPSRPRRTVCLPPRMFNSDGLTLDGMTLIEISSGQPHEVHAPDEEAFIDWWAALVGS